MNQYIIKLLLLSICFTFIYSCDVLDKEKKEEEATGNNIENIGAEIDSLKEKIQQLQEKLKQSQQTAQTPSQPQVNPQTPAQPQVNPQTPAQPQVNPQTPAQPQVNPQTPAQPQVNPQTPSQPQVNPQTPSQPQVNPQTPSQPQVNPQTLRKKEQLKRLITKQQYLQITADSKNSLVCKESNAIQLGLPSQPNSEWYYTYENFIDGMALIPKFASEGSEQIRKREIAAFFAHVAQETGTGTLYGAGCFIQELNSWGRQIYTRSTAPGNAAAGYIGRGPHQLSWNYNYKNFSDAIGRPEILQDPDILTREPAVGIAGSLWFWNHTEPGWNGNLNPPFKPSTHDVMVGNWQPTARDIAAGRTKDRYFGVTTNIINGGIECGPGSAGKRQPQNRARYFREYARILGVNLGSVTDEQLTCSTQGNFAIRPS